MTVQNAILCTVTRSRSTTRNTTRPNVRFRHLRVDEKNWTKEELARRANVSGQTVRKAERGEPISEISMAKLAKALGAPVGELFPGA